MYICIYIYICKHSTVRVYMGLHFWDLDITVAVTVTVLVQCNNSLISQINLEVVWLGLLLVGLSTYRCMNGWSMLDLESKSGWMSISSSDRLVLASAAAICGTQIRVSGWTSPWGSSWRRQLTREVVETLWKLDELMWKRTRRNSWVQDGSGLNSIPVLSGVKRAAKHLACTWATSWLIVSYMTRTRRIERWYDLHGVHLWPMTKPTALLFFWQRLSRALPLNRLDNCSLAIFSEANDLTIHHTLPGRHVFCVSPWEDIACPARYLSFVKSMCSSRNYGNGTCFKP